MLALPVHTCDLKWLKWDFKVNKYIAKAIPLRDVRISYKGNPWTSEGGIFILEIQIALLFKESGILTGKLENLCLLSSS